MIGVIDLPFCNLSAIESYLRQGRRDFMVITDYREFRDLSQVILPGVGTFGQAMKYLVDSGLKDALVEYASSNGRLIGICLGMQLLFVQSEESPGVDGLSLIDGQVKSLREDSSARIPHVGWNSLEIERGLGEELEVGDMYFVHSYSCHPADARDILTTTKHGSRFVSSVKSGNIFGFQFHPEKSGVQGYALLDQVLV